WLRLCEAVGLDRDEVLDERHLAPGVRFAVDAYVNFARSRPWWEAVASGLTEMFSGHLMQRRVADMLANYDWIRPEDLAYFTKRVEAVSGEGKQTLDIVVEHCVTREQPCSPSGRGPARKQRRRTRRAGRIRHRRTSSVHA